MDRKILHLIPLRHCEAVFTNSEGGASTPRDLQLLAVKPTVPRIVSNVWRAKYRYILLLIALLVNHSLVVEEDNLLFHSKYHSYARVCTLCFADAVEM